MADVFSPSKRSEVMSRIRGKGNKNTEGKLTQLFRQHKITGWRRHLPLPGRPDFSFPSLRVAVFVDGCFWHCCPRCLNVPATNIDFWLAKLEANTKRDRKVNRLLREQGWRVVRVWEHELRSPERALEKIQFVLKKRALTLRA